MDWLDIKEFIKDSIKYLLLIVGVMLVIIYVFTFQQVVGPSMMNTLNEGDIVFLSKSHYRVFEIKRYDIISFKYDDTKFLIKRVIGLPGDKIEFKDNKLYINDVYIEENYVGDYKSADFSLSDIGYEVIPQNMYFVRGDNRENSLDSTDSKVGLIKKEDILGKVIIRIFPFNKIAILK